MGGVWGWVYPSCVVLLLDNKGRGNAVLLAAEPFAFAPSHALQETLA